MVGGEAPGQFARNAMEHTVHLASCWKKLLLCSRPATVPKEPPSGTKYSTSGRNTKSYISRKYHLQRLRFVQCMDHSPYSQQIGVIAAWPCKDRLALNIFELSRFRVVIVHAAIGSEFLWPKQP